MELYDEILSKERINDRFIEAVYLALNNKLVSDKTTLAEALKCKPAKFSEILNGRMKAGIDMAAYICEYFDISPDWLLLSRGGYFRTTPAPPIFVSQGPGTPEYFQHVQAYKEYQKNQVCHKVDIMDEDGAVMLPIKNGKHFKEMSVGKHMLDYDSMVVLTHFKGHAMGGFGGSMKNIAIGCADGPVGKKMVHEAPDDHDYSKWRSGARFMENMADSAKATVDYFSPRIVYINVLRNMSVDCDCAGVDAAPPKTRNIGILASTDLLAVDKASIDLVYQLPENELHDLKERIESREGLHQLTAMKELGLGTDVYELVEV